MTKFILVMLLCSQINGNDCRTFEPEYVEFKSYRECARYGYNSASELMNEFSDEFIEDYRTYIKFSCEEGSTI